MSGTVELTMRPMLRSGFRLQWEPAQNMNVLLYPEGMVKLNVSACEILKRCDGTFTVLELIDELERVFKTRNLRVEVVQFLVAALAAGWLSAVA